jgi:hypothetical protein
MLIARRSDLRPNTPQYERLPLVVRTPFVNTVHEKDDRLQDLEQAISGHLGLKIEIASRPGTGGRIVVHFRTPEQFNGTYRVADVASGVRVLQQARDTDALRQSWLIGGNAERPGRQTLLTPPRRL